MAGKKGRSGPPQNLNAAKHGLTAWLKRRALPLEKQHVGKLAAEYVAGLIACKGGEGEVSEVEEALIQNAGRAFGAVLLILEEAKARGLVRKVDGGTWDLSPGFSRLVAFLSAERMALVALGLGRRAKDVDDLDAILDAPDDARRDEA
jgi:hypothetical protein